MGYGTDERTDGQTDKSETNIYPPTTLLCGGYNYNENDINANDEGAEDDLSWIIISRA